MKDKNKQAIVDVIVLLKNAEAAEDDALGPGQARSETYFVIDEAVTALQALIAK